MIAETENSALACPFVGTCAATYEIPANSLTVHQDRGAPMTSKNFIYLLAELNIGSSHSRPRVSNDNAFSEVHFKTLKTQLGYRARFADDRHALRWCGDFFDWYNDEHQHNGLNGHNPANVFHGHAQAVTAVKQSALDTAYRHHPERFVNGAPRAKSPPVLASINPLPKSVRVQARGVGLAQAVPCVHAQRAHLPKQARTGMCTQAADDVSGHGAGAHPEAPQDRRFCGVVRAGPAVNTNVCYAKRRAGAALAGTGSG